MNHHVTVHFVGICTHISRSTLSGLPTKVGAGAPPQQRVVLVNARQGHLVRETWIPPHAPELVIDYAEPQEPIESSIQLHGCTVRLVTRNSSSLPLEIKDTFQAMPNLTHLVRELTTLGEPSAEVVLDANAEHSACYFDIDFGTLSACIDENLAVIATLEVDSPELISLEITKWEEGAAPHPIPLSSGTVVWVVNMDHMDESAATDGAYPFRDFLLHYLTAAKMPHVPQVPHVIALPRCPFQHKWQTVGAGCSNSNYP
jgi:hypothetical protein